MFDFSNSLKEDYYCQSPEFIARDLIGAVFVWKNIDGFTLAGKIVETEAYLAVGDLASHSAPGLTKRNSPMFMRGGALYVYKIYGVHHCINVVTENEGVGSAVLIRAMEPLEGIETMHRNRPNCKHKLALCKGPGNLARAFGFTLKHNRLQLYSPNLFIVKHSETAEEEIQTGKRIGIAKSVDLPLRFFLRNSKSVSGNSRK